jgi:hypothetical protein
MSKHVHLTKGDRYIHDVEETYIFTVIVNVWVCVCVYVYGTMSDDACLRHVQPCGFLCLRANLLTAKLLRLQNCSEIFCFFNVIVLLISEVLHWYFMHLYFQIVRLVSYSKIISFEFPPYLIQSTVKIYLYYSSTEIFAELWRFVCWWHSCSGALPSSANVSSNSKTWFDHLNSRWSRLNKKRASFSLFTFALSLSLSLSLSHSLSFHLPTKLNLG